jgi:tRNA threonylcarbamoyl adenosine modification protein YeaZ
VLLLAFDTATPAVTVALHDGERVVAEATTVDARRQGELLAASVQKVLAEAGAELADLTAVAAGTGPGPYTGLRTGLVTARVLGSALGISAHGICTLDVIAADAVAAADGREFLVATDARRREVYWARYAADGTRLSGPAVALPAELPAGLPVAGEGGHAYPQVLGSPIEPRYPSAATLAILVSERLATATPMPAPEPLYLRRPDARVPGPPKSVSPAPRPGRRENPPPAQTANGNGNGKSAPRNAQSAPGTAQPAGPGTTASGTAVSEGAVPERAGSERAGHGAGVPSAAGSAGAGPGATGTGPAEAGPAGATATGTRPTGAGTAGARAAGITAAGAGATPLGRVAAPPADRR